MRNAPTGEGSRENLESVHQGGRAVAEALRTRRNETGAHSARRPITDPDGYIAAGRIKHGEIDKLFNVADEIATKISELCFGQAIALRLSDESDYQKVLALLSRQSP